MAAYHNALMRYEKGTLSQESAVGEATFDALAIVYYRSPNFLSLKPISQRTSRYRIDRWRVKHGAKKVAHLKRRHVVDQMAEQLEVSGAGAANNLLKILGVLCEFALELDWRSDNPCRGIRRFRRASDGFVAWSEDDVAKFEERWPLGTRQRLAAGLLLYTGQRRNDMVAMGHADLRGDTIRVVQTKTGAELAIPIHPHLKMVLSASPLGRQTFLTTSRGTPFSSQTFGNWFRMACNEAGLPNRSAHGLRKTAATRLAEAGCTSKQIQAITGHASIREIERYTRSVDQERLARQAIHRLHEGGQNRAHCQTGQTGSEKINQIDWLEEDGGRGRTRTCNQTVMSGRL